MERLIRYGNIDSIPYYNCSWRTSEEWDLQGLKRPILGWFLVLFGGFVEVICILGKQSSIVFTNFTVSHCLYIKIRF